MPAARVYLGRLSHRARERDIERFFKSYGKVREIMLKNGYGFVEFDDYRDADDAVYELNGRDLCGERVVVEHARGTPHGEDYRRDVERGFEFPSRDARDSRRSGGGGGNTSFRDKYGPPTRTDYRVRIENLSSRVSWQDLKDFMRQAGEVTYADAHKVKNEGVVEYSTRKELKKALEKLDGKELSGRKIRLIEEKPRGGGGKRSRSRSRRRSRSESSSRSKSPARKRDAKSDGDSDD